MKEAFSRTALLLGEEKVQKLNNSKVAIFGLGGVGSYVLEGLVRSGVGEFLLIDGDQVSESNLNRQIIATVNVIGQDKVSVAKDRARSINPDVKIKTQKIFYLPENSDEVDLSRYDYIVDAIDTVSSKIEIIKKAKLNRTPIISCMGTGNKLDPRGFRIGDITETKVCPLARVMRRELKTRGIENVKVLYSTEETVIKERVPASISYVPSIAGLMIAGEVIRDLTK